MQNNKQLPPGWGKNTEKPKSWDTKSTKLPEDYGNSNNAIEVESNNCTISPTNYKEKAEDFISVPSKETKLKNNNLSEQVKTCSDKFYVTNDNNTNQNYDCEIDSNKSIVESLDQSVTLSEKTLCKKAVNKKVIITSFSIITIVVLIVAVFLILLKNDNQNNCHEKTEESFSTEKVSDPIVSEEIAEKPSESTVETPSTTELPETPDPIVPEETTEQPSENTIEPPSTTELPENSDPITNLNGYIGYWYNSSFITNGDELTIDSINQNSLNFSLFFYRLTSIENVTAEIDGNTATFSYPSNGEPWTGKGITTGVLEFNESSITITITESDITYITDGCTIVFDVMYEHPWYYYQANEVPSEEDTSSTDEPIIKTDNSVYCDVCGIDCTDKNLTNGMCDDCYNYFFTPNVYCPLCEYGFFTTGVGTDGLECPKCHSKFDPTSNSHSQEFYEISGHYEEYETLSNGEHVDKLYNGYLDLYANGTAYISASGSSVNLNWDVGAMWYASNPNEKYYFETDHEYLTIYLQNNVKWIFKKIY